MGRDVRDLEDGLDGPGRGRVLDQVGARREALGEGEPPDTVRILQGCVEGRDPTQADFNKRAGEMRDAVYTRKVQEYVDGKLKKYLNENYDDP